MQKTSQKIDLPFFFKKTFFLKNSTKFCKATLPHFTCGNFFFFNKLKSTSYGYMFTIVFVGVNFTINILERDFLEIKSGFSHQFFLNFSTSTLFFEKFHLPKNSVTKVEYVGLRCYSIFKKDHFQILSLFRQIFAPREYSGEGFLFQHELENLILKKRK